MEIWTVTNYGVILNRPYTGVFKDRGEAFRHIEMQWDMYIADYKAITEDNIPTPELPELPELPDPTHTLSGYEFQFCIDPSVQDPEYAILEKHWV